MKRSRFLTLGEEYTVYEDYCDINTDDGGSNNGNVSYVCVP